MKDKKFWLYLLLGMLLCSLWLTWQQEHGRQPQPNVKNVDVVTMDAESATSLTEKFGDLPKLVEVGSKWITVKTDLLELKIDLHGGAIVESVLKDYTVSLQDQTPVKLLNQQPNERYLARSGILNIQQKNNQKAIYEVIDYVTDQTVYELKEDQLSVILKGRSAAGVQFIRTFLFQKGQYQFSITDQVINDTEVDWHGKFYAEIEKVAPKVSKGMFSFNTYTGAAISSSEKPYEKISFSQIEKISKNGGELREIQGGWLAMQQRYFINVWIPEKQEDYHYFGLAKGQTYTIGLHSNLITLAPGKQYQNTLTFYTGPELTKNLASLANGLERTADYGWLWIIAIGFFKLLTICYSLVKNWGLAIILVTVLIKLVFYKLSESSCRSMAKMKELMPKIEELKAKFGDDKLKLQQEMMELYKKEGMNPLNFGGCIPMLIQIPFFIALYYVLIGAVELRQAPFLLWIKDLSVQDPYYVLPIMMGATMFLQQKLSPTASDPAQAKMMMFMPIFFTLLFLKFPAGLVLYWVVNNLLSILQQWYINRKIEQEKRLELEKRLKQR